MQTDSRIGEKKKRRKSRMTCNVTDMEALHTVEHSLFLDVICMSPAPSSSDLLWLLDSALDLFPSLIHIFSPPVP